MKIQDLRIGNNGLRLNILLGQRDIELLTAGEEICAEGESKITACLDPDDMPPNPFYCSECGDAFSDGLESIFFDGSQYRHMRCARAALDGNE